MCVCESGHPHLAIVILLLNEGRLVVLLELICGQRCVVGRARNSNHSFTLTHRESLMEDVIDGSLSSLMRTPVRGQSNRTFVSAESPWVPFTPGTLKTIDDSVNSCSFFPGLNSPFPGNADEQEAMTEDTADGADGSLLTAANSSGREAGSVQAPYLDSDFGPSYFPFCDPRQIPSMFSNFGDPANMMRDPWA